MRQKLKLMIQEIQRSQNIFILNSTIDSLDRHYEFICQNYLPKQSDSFLDCFKKQSDLTYQSIQNYFKSFIMTNSKVSIDCDFEYVGGIYFIYDAEDTLLYIGKSKDIQKRVVESFINKLPYGSCYFRIAAPEYMSQIDTWEAVAIDFFKPPFNQRPENISLYSYREYTIITLDILSQIQKDNKRRISIHPLDFTIEVFDDINSAI